MPVPRSPGVTVEQDADGGGCFARLTIRPEVTIAEGGDPAKAEVRHRGANAECFIVKSLNLPVKHGATTAVSPAIGVGSNNPGKGKRGD